jgi:N-acyl-D-amino-acid deacylase
MLVNKVLIKNGYIVDGTGEKMFSADVLIHNEKIVKIAKNIKTGYNKIINAKGLVVAPGFIDAHSHSDVQLLQNPNVREKVMQGVTTEIIGQDGIATAPLPKRYIKRWRKVLATIDGDSDKINWKFKDTKGYLKQIESLGLGQNESYLLPHGNVRIEAMGFKSKFASKKNLEKMKQIIKREMSNGAIGLSSGIIYTPCIYAKTQELIECCKVVSELNGVFVVHQRSEADDILTSVDEIIKIAREARVKVHFSHMKVSGLKNANKIDKVFEKFDAARKEGLQITFDQYPYYAASTVLSFILPPWVNEGGTSKLVERLKSNELRKKNILDINNGIRGWDNTVSVSGIENIYIASVVTNKNKDCVGKNLVEVGKIKNKPPLEATFDLLIEEENQVGMVEFYGNDDAVVKFMNRPEQCVCTDGLPVGQKPHPRLYGSYPKILGKYVRQCKNLSLESAISKMTSKPAKTFGFNNRGEIKLNNYADIVIFNKDTIIDKATYESPRRISKGIEYVFINGNMVVKKGKYTPNPAGKVLRHNI